jgi:DegV family protein with EDD domain
MAAQELQETYPDRKIVIVDTLAASAGGGLMVYLAVEKKNAGATLEENAAYLQELVPQHCIWFIVDDLEYLKRGGRVSPAVAFFGNKLGIKPVMHVDNDGHLINVSKVRGRKNAIAALAKALGESAIDPAGGPVFISHGDCQADVDALAQILKKDYNAEVELVTDVGPVIGAHTGPGVLALFFVGKVR